ncbi:unnamed protein product [Eruca vesicaria subsp. sativa]|uniref:DUF7900 domain-containing protein n=1 Tax=Eruca vesicaria subsp. sativa TaxID=29727 RepID=A0ABC8LNM6_ERUVS|nr:unnamed protein product [Eruca vesicaria subsp. sativa]
MRYEFKWHVDLVWQSGDECNYFCWFDEEEGTKWQTRALIEARDEIREKDRVIEKLKKTISRMRDEDEDEIVRRFEDFYV